MLSRSAPHPVPLPIQWGDGGRRSGEGFLPCVRANVLLQHSELRLDAPTLADVGIFRQSILGADNVGSQPQTLPAFTATRAWAFRLQPVEQGKA
jgi:hypothetical protein